MCRLTRLFTLWQVTLISSILPVAEGRLLDVPGDFDEISTALTNSISGDTILVHRGTYLERLIFPAHDVALISEYVFTGDTAAIRGTVIDASDFAEYDTASVLNFVFGNTRSTIVDGFTLTGGHGLIGQSPGDTRRYGGGVLVAASSPTIRHCIIRQNTCTNDCAIIATSGSSPRVSRCRIFENCGETGLIGIFDNYFSPPAVVEWNDIHGNYGCGRTGPVLCDHAVIVSFGNALVSYNQFHDYESWQIMGVESYASNVEVLGNTFERITTEIEGQIVNSFDFGIVVRDNVFRNCFVGWQHCISVAAIPPHVPADRSLIERNWFENIVATQASSCLWMGDPNADIRDNVFLNCEGEVGTIQFAQGGEYGCDVVFEGNHFFYNRCPGQDWVPSVFGTGGSGPGCTFRNNWFEGNEGPAVAVHPLSDVILDLSGNYWGHASGPYDSVQNPQGQGDTLGRNVIVNSWLTSPPGTEEVTDAHDPFAPTNWSLGPAFPNPFNSQTEFRVECSLTMPFEVIVYNLMGREVSLLWRGVVPANSPRRIRWNGTDDGGTNVPSGIYLISVRASAPYRRGAVKSLKVALVR